MNLSLPLMSPAPENESVTASASQTGACASQPRAARVMAVRACSTDLSSRRHRKLSQLRRWTLLRGTRQWRSRRRPTDLRPWRTRLNRVGGALRSTWPTRSARQRVTKPIVRRSRSPRSAGGPPFNGAPEELRRHPCGCRLGCAAAAAAAMEIRTNPLPKHGIGQSRLAPGPQGCLRRRLDDETRLDLRRSDGR
jgi:hypothetical protein